MDNVRGLRTRLCPKCDETTPHRTLYVRATAGGRRRWLQLFWTCTQCGSLNHIVLPTYRLEQASSRLPTSLAIAVVKALGEKGLDFDELVMSLRKRRVPGVPHIFNSEVAMAVEFLKGRGAVTEEFRDCTERVLEGLRARSAESKHLGACPAELNLGVSRRALISLYAQKQTGAAHEMRLVPAGVLCLHCQYQRIDMSQPNYGSGRELRLS